MNLRRTAVCDVTGEEYTESQPGAGLPGWGQLYGVAVKNDKGETIYNPTLCPSIMKDLTVYFLELLSEHRPDDVG